MQHVVGTRQDAVGDVAQPGLRLLEELLAHATLGKEVGVDVRAEALPLLILDCSIQLGAPGLVGADLHGCLHEVCGDRLPQPLPSSLVLHGPRLRQQRPQRREHHGLEAIELDVPTVREVDDGDGQQVALLQPYDRLGNAV